MHVHALVIVKYPRRRIAQSCPSVISGTWVAPVPRPGSGRRGADHPGRATPKPEADGRRHHAHGGQTPSRRPGISTTHDSGRDEVTPELVGLKLATRHRVGATVPGQKPVSRRHVSAMRHRFCHRKHTNDPQNARVQADPGQYWQFFVNAAAELMCSSLAHANLDEDEIFDER